MVDSEKKINSELTGHWGTPKKINVGEHEELNFKFQINANLIKKICKLTLPFSCYLWFVVHFVF
jgi:hypothetical protein